jgi:hypothetical protein
MQGLSGQQERAPNRRKVLLRLRITAVASMIVIAVVICIAIGADASVWVLGLMGVLVFGVPGVYAGTLIGEKIFGRLPD